METLEQALDGERRDAGVLRDKGLTREAEMIDRVVARLARAAMPFTDWLSERDARLRSQWSRERLRAAFPKLEAQGLARFNPASPKDRQFLRCAIPQAANLSAAREAGRRGAKVS